MSYALYVYNIEENKAKVMYLNLETAKILRDTANIGREIDYYPESYSIDKAFLEYNETINTFLNIVATETIDIDNKKITIGDILVRNGEGNIEIMAY